MTDHQTEASKRPERVYPPIEVWCEYDGEMILPEDDDRSDAWNPRKRIFPHLTRYGQTIYDLLTSGI